VQVTGRVGCRPPAVQAVCAGAGRRRCWALQIGVVPAAGSIRVFRGRMQDSPAPRRSRAQEGDGGRAQRWAPSTSVRWRRWAAAGACEGKRGAEASEERNERMKRAGRGSGGGGPHAGVGLRGDLGRVEERSSI
jgi:hypothetical protein